MIALEGGILLPEGTEVVVTVCAGAEGETGTGTFCHNGPSGATHKRPQSHFPPMSEQECRRVREIMDRIATMPDENPGDSFSGADHDRVLYAGP